MAEKPGLGKNGVSANTGLKMASDRFVTGKMAFGCIRWHFSGLLQKEKKPLKNGVLALFYRGFKWWREPGSNR